jgi:hypothetical protein
MQVIIFLILILYSNIAFSINAEGVGNTVTIKYSKSEYEAIVNKQCIVPQMMINSANARYTINVPINANLTVLKLNSALKVNDIVDLTFSGCDVMDIIGNSSGVLVVENKTKLVEDIKNTPPPSNNNSNERTESISLPSNLITTVTPENECVNLGFQDRIPFIESSEPGVITKSVLYTIKNGRTTVIPQTKDAVGGIKFSTEILGLSKEMHTRDNFAQKMCGQTINGSYVTYKNVVKTINEFNSLSDTVKNITLYWDNGLLKNKSGTIIDDISKVNMTNICNRCDVTTSIGVESNTTSTGYPCAALPGADIRADSNNCNALGPSIKGHDVYSQRFVFTNYDAAPNKTRSYVVKTDNSMLIDRSYVSLESSISKIPGDFDVSPICRSKGFGNSSGVGITQLNTRSNSLCLLDKNTIYYLNVRFIGRINGPDSAKMVDTKDCGSEITYDGINNFSIKPICRFQIETGGLKVDLAP